MAGNQPDTNGPAIDPGPFFHAWGASVGAPLLLVRIESATIAYANAAATALLAPPGGTLIGAPLRAIFPPERDRDTDLWFREWVALARTGDAPPRSATFLRGADGGDHPFEIDASLFDAEGVELAGCLFRKADGAPSASVELLQARDLLAMSQRLMDAGSWEWRLKENRLFWTPQTYRIFGVSPETFTPSFDRFLSFVHPDDRPLIDAQPDRLTQRDSSSIEYRIVRPNGQVRRVRDFLSVRTATDGSVERVEGAIQDITDQWRIDEAFRLVAAGIGGASEGDFFESLTRSLTDLLAMEMAFVAELDDTGANLASIAVSLHGVPAPGLSIPVQKKGACHRMLVEKQPVALTQGVWELYPDLPLPEGSRFEGMAGAPLLSHEGIPFGVMVVMDSAPLRDEQHVLDLLSIFSQRASVELERLQSVRALTRSEARTQSIIRTTMQGFWFIDDQAVTIEANARMGQILGLPCASLPGRSIYDFVDEENAAIFRAQIRERGTGAHSVYEITLTRADGGQVACLFSASPFTDDRGAQRGSFALVTDISDRKMVENELRRSEESLNRAQRIARIGSWSWRIETDRVELSEQGWRIIGKEPHELTLYHFLEGTPTLEREHLLTSIDETLEGNGTILLESPYDTGGKEPSILIIEAEADRDNRGQVVGLVGVVHDVTRQRKLEQERSSLEVRYRQAQKLESLGLVAGGINHDFNNILQQLLGLVNLLGESVPRTGREREYLDLMQGAINRGSASLRRLLAFSRQSIDSSVIIDPCRILSVVVGELRRDLPPGVSLSYHCELAHDVTLMADPGQLRHAVGNLLRNALDAVGERGSLSISISPAPPPPDAPSEGESWVRIDVDDSGPGVPSIWRERIFDPFFTTRQGGEGLGLPIAHGIVRAHGGELFVESDRERGARFSILLPTASPREPSLPPPTPPSERPMRVYFLDDEELIVTTMSIMMKRFNVEMVGFTSPVEMMEAFEKDADTLDGVVTDLSMSEFSGIELARKVKQRRPDLRVVLCTGFSPDKDWSDEERDAVDAILYKPVGPEALVEALTGRLPEPS